MALVAKEAHQEPVAIPRNLDPSPDRTPGRFEELARIGEVDWVDSVMSATTAVWYFGLLFYAGAAIFAWLCLPPSGDNGQSRIPGRRIALATGSLSAAASLLLIWLQAIRIAGRLDLNPSEFFEVIDSRQFISGAGTVVGLVLIFHMLWKVSRPGASVVVAGATVAIPVLTGHSAAKGPAWVMIPADLTHLVSGAIWVGGLVLLVLSLRQTENGADPTDRMLFAVSRFSTLIAVSLTALTVSGTAMALLIVSDMGSLTQSRYGLLLVAKICFVILLVSMALWNHRRLERMKVEKTARQRWDLALRIWRRELSILLVVIVVTGVLVTQSPEDHSHPQPSLSSVD